MPRRSIYRIIKPMCRFQFLFIQFVVGVIIIIMGIIIVGGGGGSGSGRV
jgi:hypothetical protein